MKCGILLLPGSIFLSHDMEVKKSRCQLKRQLENSRVCYSTHCFLIFINKNYVINVIRGVKASFQLGYLILHNMKVNVIFETSSDGYFSCYVQENVPDFALFGYGNSAQEAKSDMLKSYEEIKSLLASQGKKAADLQFVYHYDMKSFFDYFNFLNQSKIAERAGINASLMRKYTSGVARAGEGQYQKLQKAIQSITEELQVAAF